MPGPIGEVKAQPAPSGGQVRAWLGRPPVLKRFLVAGIIALALYAAMDLVLGLRYQGYSFKSQTVSEISAVGAPSRTAWNVLGIVYGALALGFGAGVWRAAGPRRTLSFAGALLIVLGLISFAWLLAPMHRREVLAASGPTTTDQVHLAFAGLDSVVSLLAIGFAAATFGKRFKIYSVATVLLLLVFGFLTGLDAPGIQNNDPTAWAGVFERINIYGFMLWTAVLAIVLLREKGAPASAAAPDRAASNR